jgi:hypothetical protein
VRTAVRVLLVNVLLLSVPVEGHKEVKEKQKQGNE